MRRSAAAFTVIGALGWGAAWANNLSASVTGGISYAAYERQAVYRNLTRYDAIIGLRYLDRFSVLLNLGSGNASGRQAGRYTETHTNGQIQLHTYQDWLKSRVSIRAFAYRLDSNVEADADSWAAGVALLNYGNTFYANVDYSQTRVGSHQSGNYSINTKQWSGGIESSLGLPRFWFSLQPVLVNIDETDEQLLSVAIEASYVIQRVRSLSPYTITVGALSGEQQYAVNHRQLLVYNTDGVLKTGFWTNAEWRLDDHTALLAGAGQNSYTNATQGDYAQVFTHLSITYSW